MQAAPRQTISMRALHDTLKFGDWGWLLLVASAVSVAISEALVNLVLLPDNPSRGEEVLYNLGGIGVGLVAAFASIFFWNLAWTPVRQRNEAWLLLDDRAAANDLAVIWGGRGISLALHGEGGADLKTSRFSTEPVDLIYSGEGTMDIERVILLARISYGPVTSWNAIRQTPADGASRLHADLTGQPIELAWSPENERHARELEGLPITIRSGDPLKLPQLWLEVADPERAIQLFEEWGTQAIWRWSLTIHTDQGRYFEEIATPIMMQSATQELATES